MSGTEVVERPETTEKTEETNSEPRHIFCGVCYRDAREVPGVREALCGEIALSEGRYRTAHEVNECPNCVLLAERMFGCSRCAG